MKKFLYVLLCLLLIAGIGGSAVLIAKTVNNDTQIEQPGGDSVNDDFTEDSNTDGNGNTNNDSSSQTPDSGNTDDGETEDNLPTLKGLKIPENEADYIADGLSMVTGAQLSLTEGDRALRFTCNVSTELYNEVMADVNKEIGMLVFPTKFFDQVNTKGYTYMDWIKVFDEELEVDYSYLPYDESIIGTTDTGYYMRYKLYNIAYAGINQPISCLGVLKTTQSDGSVSYKYASMPSGETYQSNARSMAYLAAATLNANTLGMETLTDAQLTMVKGFINESVDKANGLAEPTNDGSTYLFEVSPTGPKTLSVGQTFKVDVDITPDVNVPVWYRSTDTSVVTVDDQGNVKALKAGTAVIGVYVAGEAFGITVTVS